MSAAAVLRKRNPGIFNRREVRVRQKPIDSESAPGPKPVVDSGSTRNNQRVRASIYSMSVHMGKYLFPHRCGYIEASIRPGSCVAPSGRFHSSAQHLCTVRPGYSPVVPRTYPQCRLRGAGRPLIIEEPPNDGEAAREVAVPNRFISPSALRALEKPWTTRRGDHGNSKDRRNCADN